jgi:hypothetical protein
MISSCQLVLIVVDMSDSWFMCWYVVLLVVPGSYNIIGSITQFPPKKELQHVTLSMSRKFVSVWCHCEKMDMGGHVQMQL